MEKKLVRTSKVWHYDDDGNRIEGVPEGITGDLSGVSGNLSGISGDLSGVSGNVNNCKLTADDRKNGVDISELIREEE